MKKSWPIALLGLTLIVVIWVSCFANPSDQKQQQGAANNAQVAGSPPQQPEASDNRQAAPHSPGLRRLFAWPDGVTALGILLTLFFIAWQTLLTREAINSSDKASRQELRAYLGVLVNTACYQDRDKEVRFEGIPTLINTGKTPAHRVRYRSAAAVLREPVAAGYAFVPGHEVVGEYVVGVSNPYTLHVILDDYVDAQDVPDIMSGTKGRAFYYWGIVEYDDAFGDSHTTEFCHRIFFTPDTENVGQFKVSGKYVAGKNNAT